MDIILAGSSSCMREIVWQMQELNLTHPTWNIVGYVDADKEETGVMVGGQKIPCLGDDDVLLRMEQPVNVAICVGSSSLRKKIAQKLQRNPQLKFPCICLGDTRICKDVQMGKGCIISMDARISTNVRLGDFVFLNTGAMVCHDGCIGDFVTLSPDVKLAGAVTVGAECDLGMGTKVIQGVHITERVTTGAGCVVVRDVHEPGTYVGVPAQTIRKRIV